MITHVNYDTNSTHTAPGVLPDVIDKIEVLHDGGRFHISINDKEIYNGTAYGVRDCVITVDRQPLAKTSITTKRKSK
jgi:hypothetical protein